MSAQEVQSYVDSLIRQELIVKIILKDSFIKIEDVFNLTDKELKEKLFQMMLGGSNGQTASN